LVIADFRYVLSESPDQQITNSPILMPFSTLLKVGWRVAKLGRRDRWTREQILEHQARSLQQLRRHAYAHSPFYRQFHRGLTDRPLQELPILTKPIMMDNFEQLVTDPSVRLSAVESFLETAGSDSKFLNRYIVTSTSGTTGRRAIVLSDSPEWSTYIAALARPMAWAGLPPARRRRTAHVVSTVPWSMSARAGASLNSRISLSIRIDTHEALESIVRQLNDWRPQVLASYASMAGELADEQAAGRLKIQPEIIITAAEVLTEDIRARVEAAWGKVLFNLYGATESVIAAECEQHSGLHLFEDLGIFEIVDERGRPVPDGEYGERLLVTSLFRRTQPLIRYEISDMVRLAKDRCPCNRPFPLIDGIQGRIEEVLRFPSSEGAQVAIDPIFFEPILGPVPASAWQLIQERDGLTIKFAGLASGFDTGTIAETLRSELGKKGAVVPAITILPVDSIPRSASGKAPLIKASVANVVELAGDYAAPNPDRDKRENVATGYEEPNSHHGIVSS
jgi:phenylacetate-CoA ligase